MTRPRNRQSPAKYEQPRAGQYVFPVLRGYKLCCCDCGLVHTVAFDAIRITSSLPDGRFKYQRLDRKRYRVLMRVWRDNVATRRARG